MLKIRDFRGVFSEEKLRQNRKDYGVEQKRNAISNAVRICKNYGGKYRAKIRVYS